MRITILALGSRGDVQPFVPLGKALQAAGHRVCVATFSLFKPMLHEAGLGFHPIHGDAQALLQTATQKGLLERGKNPLRMFQALRHSYGSLAEILPADLQSLQDTDLLLNQLPAHLFGPELAAHLKIPWAIVAVLPLSLTCTRPLVGFPQKLSFLPGYNALTYRLGEQIGWQLFRHTINRWRTQQLGLPAAPFWGEYEAIRRQAVPVLYGFSHQVVPRPPDWGTNIQIHGWWYPEDPAWQPSTELERFIEAGQPPVFIGFGSMPVRDPAAVTRLLVEVVRQCGQRAILHAGWAGLGGELPEEIFLLSYAPYGWLFPRMAAVVHHGGSGTTGFALRSGIPSLVVPFGFDQFYWGARTSELGAGPAPVPYARLSVDKLAAAIHTAVSDPQMHRQAADLGRKLAAEDGLQRTVAFLQSFA